MLNASVISIMLAHSLFFAYVLIIINRQQRPEIGVLTALFLANAISQVFNLFNISAYAEAHAALRSRVMVLGLVFGYAYGPLILLYSRALMGKPLSNRRKDMKEAALVSATLTLLTLPYVVVSPVLQAVVPHPPQTLQAFNEGAGLAVLLLILAYVPYTYVYLYRAWRLMTKHTDVEAAPRKHWATRWPPQFILFLTVIWTLFGIEVVDDFFLHLDLISTVQGNLIEAGIVFALSLLALRQIVEWIFTPAPQAETATPRDKYAKSKLPSGQAARLAKRLEQAMLRDKLYRDPFLNLKRLSEHTGVNTHRLSQVLNTHMESSFFDFVNRWRIGEAKELLANSDQTVLEIAHDVGFNSRSSFNAAFKKSTGRPPSAFRP